MLGKAPRVPELPTSSTANGEPYTALGEGFANALIEDTHAAPTREPHAPEPDRVVEDVREVHVNAAAGSVRLSFRAGVRLTRRVPATSLNEQPVEHDSRVQKPLIDDRMFTFAAIGLAIVILVLVAKKLRRLYGLDG